MSNQYETDNNELSKEVNKLIEEEKSKIIKIKAEVNRKEQNFQKIDTKRKVLTTNISSCLLQREALLIKETFEKEDIIKRTNIVKIQNKIIEDEIFYLKTIINQYKTRIKDKNKELNMKLYENEALFNEKLKDIDNSLTMFLKRKRNI